MCKRACHVVCSAGACSRASVTESGDIDELKQKRYAIEFAHDGGVKKICGARAQGRRGALFPSVMASDIVALHSLPMVPLETGTLFAVARSALLPRSPLCAQLPPADTWRLPPWPRPPRLLELLGHLVEGTPPLFLLLLRQGRVSWRHDMLIMACKSLCRQCGGRCKAGAIRLQAQASRRIGKSDLRRPQPPARLRKEGPPTLTGPPATAGDAGAAADPAGGTLGAASLAAGRVKAACPGGAAAASEGRAGVGGAAARLASFSTAAGTASSAAAAAAASFSFAPATSASGACSSAAASSLAAAAVGSAPPAAGASSPAASSPPAGTSPAGRASSSATVSDTAPAGSFWAGPSAAAAGACRQKSHRRRRAQYGRPPQLVVLGSRCGSRACSPMPPIPQRNAHHLTPTPALDAAPIPHLLNRCPCQPFPSKLRGRLLSRQLGARTRRRAEARPEDALLL